MFIFHSYVCWKESTQILYQFDVDLHRKADFHQYSSQEFSLQLFYEALFYTNADILYIVSKKDILEVGQLFTTIK